MTRAQLIVQRAARLARRQALRAALAADADGAYARKAEAHLAAIRPEIAAAMGAKALDEAVARMLIEGVPTALGVR